MIFKRFYNDYIAQASFLVGCAATGEAIAIDPNRDLDQYLEAAKAEGLRIVAVTETHVHADYVSGSRELAALTGATLYLSKEGGPDWQYAFEGERVGNGDAIQIGNLRLKVLHTPGHTPEHIAFELTDGAASDQPVGVFTGDFIFAGDVGRPDLLEVAAGYGDTMRKGAQALYGSLVEFKGKQDWLTLWPGHGAGSSCGKKLGGVPSTTLGYEKVVNAALRFPTEESFIEDILAGQPEPPKYFARMKKVNKEGPAPTRDLMTTVQMHALPSSNVKVIDVRSTDQFLAGSAEGAISIPFDRSFAKWAGSLIGPEETVVLIAESPETALEATKTLVLIGLERTMGWVAASDVARDAQLRCLNAQEAVALKESAYVLDVRGSAERKEDGSLAGAIHVPLPYLADKELPTDRPIAVHCYSGGRAIVAASYLASKGYEAMPIRAKLEDLLAQWPVSVG